MTGESDSILISSFLKHIAVGACTVENFARKTQGRESYVTAPTEVEALAVFKQWRLSSYHLSTKHHGPMKGRGLLIEIQPCQMTKRYRASRSCLTMVQRNVDA
jgi:hypothetical protein